MTDIISGLASSSNFSTALTALLIFLTLNCLILCHHLYCVSLLLTTLPSAFCGVLDYWLSGWKMWYLDGTMARICARKCKCGFLCANLNDSLYIICKFKRCVCVSINKEDNGSIKSHQLRQWHNIFIDRTKTLMTVCHKSTILTMALWMGVREKWPESDTTAKPCHEVLFTVPGR